MKAISASIVILAGSLTFAVGATIQHSDTRMGVCAVGFLIGVAGIAVWIGTIVGKID
jgi:hypothetical protein